MKPMRNIKPRLWIKAAVFSTVFLTSLEAQAENWIEVDKGRLWYNSDYTFRDWVTSFVVVEVAEYNNDTYSYFLDAIDCTKWVFRVVGIKDANGNYELNSNWRTNERYTAAISPGYAMDRIAKQVCPNRNNFRYDEPPS